VFRAERPAYAEETLSIESVYGGGRGERRSRGSGSCKRSSSSSKSAPRPRLCCEQLADKLLGSASQQSSSRGLLLLRMRRCEPADNVRAASRLSTIHELTLLLTLAHIRCGCTWIYTLRSC